MIILYSTGCPRCLQLEKLLNQHDIEYDIFTDAKAMIKMGFKEAPMLEINEQYKTYNEAIQWLKERGVTV